MAGIGAALVSAGGSLLGGLLGKKPMSPARMIESHMQGIRKGAEKWGFNPLAWAGTTGSQGAAPPNYMGAAIADATASVADAWSNNAFNKAQVDQLEMQNEKMRRELNAEKIRPTVPGLYDRGGLSPNTYVGGTERTPAVVGQPFAPEPEWGETIETREGDYPLVVEGPLNDRPMEIEPVLNVPWFKKVRIGERDVTVWNDEAMESEAAAAASLVTVPAQIWWQDLKEGAKKLGGNPADRKGGVGGIFQQGEKNLTEQMGENWWKDQFGAMP